MVTEIKVSLTMVSENVKTGPIPVSTVSRTSCPQTCPLKDAGCYGDGGPVRIHWDRITRGERGTDWETFVTKVSKFRPLQPWRHCQVGDQPHNDGVIDEGMMRALVDANRRARARGWTYTHHLLDNETNVALIREANESGFTVNASCESVGEADRVMSDMRIPSVAVVQSDETRKLYRTSSGRRVVVCPAVTMPHVTCATCGNGRPLCQRADRDYIVAFPAHGFRARKVDSKVRKGT